MKNQPRDERRQGRCHPERLTQMENYPNSAGAGFAEAGMLMKWGMNPFQGPSPGQSNFDITADFVTIQSGLSP